MNEKSNTIETQCNKHVVNVRYCIAVFTENERDFKALGLFPRKNFIRIRTVENIMGRRFDGIIMHCRWYECDREILRAREALEHRQPELFNAR